MPSEREVYEKHANQYERLIQREDYNNHILPALEKICPLGKLDAIDLGAGTGRITRIIAPHVANVRAFDSSSHMLAKAEVRLHSMGLTNWKAGVAHHHRIPVANKSADLVIAGWSFCYLAVWGGKNWRNELELGYEEIYRILRPGGVIIFLETLGTGAETPNPPKHLSNYFAWLDDKGFQNTWIRTDYQFNSLEEAIELSDFFFGRTMAKMVEMNRWIILPECTGIWWQRKLI